MRCQEVRCQLARYRELNVSEREQLQEHLSVCPDCAAALEAYVAQDRVLASMPQLARSGRLRAAVQARTKGQRSTIDRCYRIVGVRDYLSRVRDYAALRWGLVAAMVLLLLVGLPSSTARASDALPGDLLYPYKRAGEQVRLALLVVRPQTREAYRVALVEQRRAEVRRLLTLRRAVAVQFGGRVEALNPGGVWLIEGISVVVPARAWVGALPGVGSLVAVEARLVQGQVVASRVRPRPARAKPTPDPDQDADINVSPMWTLILRPAPTRDATSLSRAPGTGAYPAPRISRTPDGPRPEPRGSGPSPRVTFRPGEYPSPPVYPHRRARLKPGLRASPPG